MLGLTGVTAIEDSVAPVTVSVVVPETAPRVAVIVVEPTATDAASPLEPAALLIVATAKFEELHVTNDDISCVVESEYVPVAINCFVNPFAMLGLVGVTAIDDSVALVTFSVVVPEIPKVAVIVVEPATTDVASPLEPAALLIVATGKFEELHVTNDDISCVVLSE
jgi:hypothetical protein